MAPEKDAKDTQAVDNDASSTLEKTVAAMQAKILAGATATPPVKDDPPVTEPPKDDPPVVKPVVTVTPPEDEGDEPIIPAGHRRAAIARGWTAEEVDHYLETKPEEAAVTFRETFDQWQKESSEWSARGRMLMAAAGDDPPPKDADGGDEVVPVVKLDADALIEQHGNEDLIKALIGPFNIMVDRLNVATTALSKSQKATDASQVEALATEAQSFLMSEGMKSFREMYGTEIKDLTDGQMKKRLALFSEGDVIMAGARHHGQEPSINDVLTRAHAIVSRGSRDTEIRDSIRKSMETRTKTSRTTHKTSAPADTGNEPISDAELEKRTEARLRELRNKR